MASHSDRGPASHSGSSLSREQLRGYEHGWAVTIMPVGAGWKIQYFSSPDFERESGTEFSTLEAALDAIATVLPAANSEEQRQRAREELAELERLARDHN
jgi:hypothetical protein